MLKTVQKLAVLLTLFWAAAAAGQGMNPERVDALIGGTFSAGGSEYCDDTAVLASDHWLDSGSYPFQNVAGDTFATVRDRLYWRGSWWLAGEIHIGGTDYAFARRADDEGVWTGFRVEAGGDEGDGYRLCIWDAQDGNGERLYCSRQGGGFAPNVLALDYDPETHAITANDIGWWTFYTGVDPTMVWAMQVADLGDGEALYLGGESFIAYPGSDQDCMVKFDGTTLTALAGPRTNNDNTGQIVLGLTVHDFGDGVKRLVAVGRFRRVQTGGSATTTDWLNVAAYDPANDWVRVKTGISLTNLSGQGFTHIGCCASFNRRLWVGITTDQYSNLNPGTGPLLAFDGDLSTGAWLRAGDLLTNLDGDAAGSELTRFILSGSLGSRVRAPINSMAVYDGRLILAGGQTFRKQWRGLVSGGSLSWSTGAHGATHTSGMVCRVLPKLDGDVRPLCIYDTSLILGGTVSLAGTAIRNVCAWVDPGGVEKVGTLNTLGGGVNGPVHGACVFDGDLYVIGDFTDAGGVAVKGIARWNGSTWGYVVNISDYGSPRVVTATSSRLIVAGTFDKVDGSSTYAHAVALDSSLTKSALFTSASYAAGAPTIRAVYVSNDGATVYLGGLIDTIVHAGGTLSCHQIARMAVASWGTWDELLDDDADPAHDGITTGSVFAIGEQNGKILAGCEPTAKAGTNSTANLLWKWATSGDWTVVESALTGDSEAVSAITQNSDASVAWVTVSGRAVSSETFFPRARVRRYSGGTPTGAWVGRDSNSGNEANKGQSFAAQPTALVFGDAGNGDHLYIAGRAVSPGSAAVEDLLLPSNLLSAITADDKVADVAGGLGGPGWFSAGSPRHQVVRVQRTIVGEPYQEETLMIDGTPTGGSIALTIYPPNPTLAAAPDDVVVSADWASTVAGFVTNLNDAMDAALGDGQIIAAGTEWEAITLTRSGGSQARLRHRPVSADISSLTGATAATVTVTKRVPDALLACCGSFSTQNAFNAQYLCGLDRHGVLIPVDGQLSGRNPSYFGPRDIKPVPRAEWPAEWLDPTVAPMTLPQAAWSEVAILGVGGFTQAINSAVRDKDAGIIHEVEPAPGIFARYGDEFVGVGIETGPGSVEAVEVYDGVIVAGGIGGKPQYFDYSTQAWLDLEGGTPYEGITRAMLRWDGKLRLAGGFSNNGGTTWYPLLEWDGAAMTPRSLPDFTNDVNVDLRCLTEADLGDGAQLYAGGYGGLPGASFRGEVCPVVRSADGTTWSKVGNDAQLNGTCYGLAELRYSGEGRTNILVAHGQLYVDEGSGWVYCMIAWYDGAWHAGPYEAGSPAEGFPFGDWRGLALCCESKARVLVPTWSSEVAPTAIEIGGDTGQSPRGLYVFRHPDDGMNVPEPMSGGGVNGVGGGAVCAVGVQP